jgi:hypothetical protein
MRAGVALGLVALSPRLARAGEPTVIDTATFFPEGPVVVEGKSCGAQYAGNVVTVRDGSTSTDIWKAEGCGPSAVVPTGDDFAIACHDSGRVGVIGRDGSTPTSHDKDADGQPRSVPTTAGPTARAGPISRSRAPEARAGGWCGRGIRHRTAPGVAWPMT